MLRVLLFNGLFSGCDTEAEQAAQISLAFSLRDFVLIYSVTWGRLLEFVVAQTQ